MKIVSIEYSRQFIKMFRRLPKDFQLQAFRKECIFKKDCFDPRLNTHKLGGDLEGLWAFSINRSYRILFEFIDGKAGFVGFINVGTHDQVYR